MKYKVIGWTNYDEFSKESTYASYAAICAIIDDIKENGYLFSGMDHQYKRGCAPVLNDGRMRLFSDREFGMVMAEAHGYHGSMDYAIFAFDIDGKCVYPSKERKYNKEALVLENLSENFVFELDEKQWSEACSTLVLKLDDSPKLRYLDIGDTAMLRCGDKTADYKIVGVEKEKDFSLDDRVALYMHNEEAEKKWQNAKIITTIRLEKIND